jgi:hypothetical protein
LTRPSSSPLLALGLLAMAALAWALWPTDTAEPLVAVPPPMALPLPQQLAAQDDEVAPTAAAPATSNRCETTPALRPQDQALAQQRAVQVLASGDAAAQVLALLLQKPADADPAPLAAWAQQLQGTALRSGDATALRWVAPACAYLPAASACRQQVLRARVQLEPQNGLHWAEWLDEEPAAAEQAWQGLAAASYWHERPAAASERIAQALGPALTPAQREALLRPLREQLAAWAPPPSAALTSVCGHWGPTHPAGAACAQATTLMLSHSDSAEAAAQGVQLGRQLGRDEAELAAAQVPLAQPVMPAACKPAAR